MSRVENSSYNEYNKTHCTKKKDNQVNKVENFFIVIWAKLTFDEARDILEVWARVYLVIVLTVNWDGGCVSCISSCR